MIPKISKGKKTQKAVKNIKKSGKQIMAGPDRKQMFVQNLPLFLLLAVVVVLSTFAIGSYFRTTNLYLDEMKVSVITEESEEDSDGAKATQKKSEKKAVYEIFTDVKSNHKNAKAIEKLLGEGVINGYTDGSFKPNLEMNRAEIVFVLTTALDVDFAQKKLDYCFSDVGDQWFAPFVCYAKEKNWINGYAGNRFGSSETVTLAEALKIILTAFEYDIPSENQMSNAKFALSLSKNDWFFPYAYLARERGIIETAEFNAFQKISRAEFVQIVYNAMLDKNLLQ